MRYPAGWVQEGLLVWQLMESTHCVPCIFPCIPPLQLVRSKRSAPWWRSASLSVLLVHQSSAHFHEPSVAESTGCHSEASMRERERARLTGYEPEARGAHSLHSTELLTRLSGSLSAIDENSRKSTVETGKFQEQEHSTETSDRSSGSASQGRGSWE